MANRSKMTACINPAPERACTLTIPAWEIQQLIGQARELNFKALPSKPTGPNGAGVRAGFARAYLSERTNRKTVACAFRGL